MPDPIPLQRRVLSEDEFNTIKQQVLSSLPAGLSEQDFNRQIGPAMQQALAQAEYTNPEPQGGAVGRFVGGAAQMLNPITAVQGVYQAVRHPIDTVTNQIGQMGSQWSQARDLANQGRMVEAAGHAAAGSLPVIGPIAAGIGQQAAQGDVAGAAGRTTGLLAPIAVGEVLKARAASNAGDSAQADILERQAQQQVADKVLAPGNPRFKGRAQAIAPELLDRGLSGDRPALQQAAAEGMQEAVQRIDDAAKNVGALPVPEVIAGYQKAIRELQDSKGLPLSDAAAARIAKLQQRITEMKARGGVTNMISLDDLKAIRDENYRIADEARGYEVKGNPSLSDEGYAAREAGTAIKDVIARRSPETAAANADYTFYKNLYDILDPTVGRPKSTALPPGVTGGARVTGALAGTLLGSKAGAFILGTVLPWVREHLNSPQWQLADAQSKMRLAQAMRNGDIGAMKSALVRLGEATAATNAATSESMPEPAMPAGGSPR